MCDLQTQNGPFVLNQNFFVKTIHTTFIHLFVALSLWRIKKFQKRIQSYKDSSFPGTKWLIRPKSDFFEKNNSYNLHVPLGSFIAHFFRRNPQSRSRFMRMCHFQIVAYVSVLYFGPQLGQNCTFGPKKDFFRNFT